MSADQTQTLKEQVKEENINFSDIHTSIEFPFEINQSFLNASSHPITILKKYNPILEKHINRNHCPITLHTFNNLIKAFIYYGEAGYGPYYQIRIPSSEHHTIVQDYHLGQLLKVKIMFKESVEVFLENSVPELQL